ncbi:MAG: flagellar hook-basal body complex protein, partial [Candidatus Rokubacteria bacterium]|nr:flagellar hook-basal body complex protein [Candidatus Rokubacteria bacterium]
MLRSLFTGVTGLRSHSQWLDVIGNNIANVDTVGYKTAGVTFQDLLSQTIQGEVRPNSGQGGVSVKQVGLGVTVGSIRNFFNQGALQQTGNPTDLAIQGDGFFALSSGADTLYTRAGAFTLDANGTLVDSVTGYTVQGASGDVTIAPGSTVAATATTTEYLKGNLDASVADGETYTLTLPVYDSLGTSHTVTLTFTKNFAAASGQWDWAATESDANIASLGGAAGSLIFNSSGAISSVPPQRGHCTAVDAGGSSAWQYWQRRRS